jgi:osmotically-inducible protein OsmY
MRTMVLACVLLMSCSQRMSSSTDQRVGVTTVTAATVAPLESDQQIIRRIERDIAADPALSTAAAAAEVDAFDGAVVLRGSVADPATKAALVAIAEGTGHVVLDKISVSPTATEAQSDDTVAFKLQRGMLNDPAVAPEMDGVSIDVVRGKVTLRGKVSSNASRTAVASLVEATPGVNAVTNELTVR